MDSNKGTVVPEPGVYYDIPFAQYLQWKAVNHTTLKAGYRSMAHMRYVMDNGSMEPTKAMQFGTLVHAVCLEPETIGRRFAVEPDLTVGITKADGSPTSHPKATAEYKKRYAEFVKMSGDRQIVTQDDYTRMEGVLRSLKADKVASEVLVGGRNEVCVVFVEKSSGVLCKARLDKLDMTGNKPRVVDIKTTRDIRRFQYEMLRSGYASQAAFYSEAVTSIDGVMPDAFLVVVENEPPFCVKSDYISAGAIDWGRQRFKEALRQYAACVKEDKWPGPATSETGWDLPQFAYDDLSKEDLSWDDLMEVSP